MSGSIYVLKPEATRLLRALLDTTQAHANTGSGDIEAPGSRTPDHQLVTQLVDAQVVRPVGTAPTRREALMRSLARRSLLWALAAADRTPEGPYRLLQAARWGVALFGWAETVRVWEERYQQPLPAIDGRPEVSQAIDRGVRRAAAQSLVGMRCKERALACLGLARRDGVRADLVVGLADFPVAAHVWVECGKTILGDDPEFCCGFTPVARYSGRGAQEPV